MIAPARKCKQKRVDKECAHCGKRRLMRTDVRFCSKRCGGLARFPHKQSKASILLGSLRQCVICTTHFVPRVGKQQVCSRECALKFNAAKQRERYTSVKRFKVRKWRRRFGPVRPTWRPEVKQAVWQKCNGKCWLCDGQCSKRYDKDDPLSPTIDHIKPWSQGGSNEIDNLMLAHARCNSLRGDRGHTDTRRG